MKKSVLVVACVLVASASFAQKREVKWDDWNAQKKAADSTLAVRKNQQAACASETAALNNKLASVNKQAEDLQNEIYALVEGDKAKKDAYSSELDGIDNRVKGLAALSNDDLFARKAELDVIEADLNQLRKNKLSLLPENARRIEGLVSQIDQLRKVQPTAKTVAAKGGSAFSGEKYTVGTWAQDRDCLWNIAKKKSIYDNPFKWPTIYNANKDQIKDPNLIYPGQVLTIPKG